MTPGKGQRSSYTMGADAFLRFGAEFRSPAWRPYYVRWERLARLSLDHQWLARAEIEVHRGGAAMVRVRLNSASRRPSPLGEAAFGALRANLEHIGYELRHEPRLPQTLFLKQFRSTGAGLATARRQIEACLWPQLRAHRSLGPARGGIPGAMDHFLGAPTWVPSSCGWSRRIRLRNGVEVLFAILLMPREKGQGHHPEACVQLEPPKGVSRGRLRGLVELAEAAGWQADEVRPTGRALYPFINFWKSRLGPAGAAGARARLDALAEEMRGLPW